MMDKLGVKDTRPQNRHHRVHGDLIAVDLQAGARKVERFRQPRDQQTRGPYFRACGQDRTRQAAKQTRPDESEAVAEPVASIS